MDDVAIHRAGADRVDDLEPLYRALHAHHLTVARVPLVKDPDASWERRREWYLEKLGQDALLWIAERAGRPVGYALVELHAGPDDTWPVADRYAELVSLAVAPDERGHGVGGRLMDAVEEELESSGVDDLMVGVMDGNDDAVRFYARRGLVTGELIMWRFGRVE
ncbi:MAG: GNAT family N-acetyltransferase [Gaiellales bacterium]